MATEIRAVTPGNADPVTVLLLARLLDRLERSGRPVDAGQYRMVVMRLVGELARLEPGDTLQALLDGNPALAELYENLNHQHAGLCQSALDPASAAEQEARRAIEIARRVSNAGSAR